MSKWSNKSGIPLGDKCWLEVHHRAKITERENFAKKILKKNPKKIVDLGCGTGLWLELLNKEAPKNCKFVGFDIDEEAISVAKERAKLWERDVEFITLNIDSEDFIPPEADLYLAFNILQNIKFVGNFLEKVRSSLNLKGNLVIRQYDGSNIRYGPMETKKRIRIKQSLFDSVGYSNKFRHYDIDNIFQILQMSNFSTKDIYFELYQKTFPYPDDFLDYFKNTLLWEMDYLSDNQSKDLKDFFDIHLNNNSNKPSYFFEIDLVAVLS